MLALEQCPRKQWTSGALLKVILTLAMTLSQAALHLLPHNLYISFYYSCFERFKLTKSYQDSLNTTFLVKYKYQI